MRRPAGSPEICTLGRPLVSKAVRFCCVTHAPLFALVCHILGVPEHGLGKPHLHVLRNLFPPRVHVFFSKKKALGEAQGKGSRGGQRNFFRAAQDGPVNVGAEVLAADQASGQGFYLDCALGGDSAVPRKPLIDKWPSHAECRGQLVCAAKHADCSFDGSPGRDF